MLLPPLVFGWRGKPLWRHLVVLTCPQQLKQQPAVPLLPQPNVCCYG